MPNAVDAGPAGKEIPDPETNARQALILQQVVSGDKNHPSGLCTPATDLFEALRYAAESDPAVVDKIRGDMIQFFLLRRGGILRRGASANAPPMAQWSELHAVERGCIEDGAMNMDRLRECYLPGHFGTSSQSPPPPKDWTATNDKLADMATDFLLRYANGTGHKYVDAVGAMIDAGGTHILLHYADLVEHSPYLAGLLATNPNESLPVFDRGLMDVADLWQTGYSNTKDGETDRLSAAEARVIHRVEKHALRVRIAGFDAGREKTIRQAGSKTNGKLVAFDGIVWRVAKTQQRPLVKMYYCSPDGHPNPVVQDPYEETPKPAACEHKDCRNRRMTEEETESRNVDFRVGTLRELPEGLGENEEPAEVEFHLEGDQVDAVRLMDRVRLTGMYYIRADIPRRGPKPNDGMSKGYVAVNNVEYLDGLGNRTFQRVDRNRLSPEDEERIDGMLKAEGGCLEFAMGTLAPQLIDFDVVKEMTIYQQAAPATEELLAGGEMGRTHIFLPGPYGTGKSEFLKAVRRVVTGAVYFNGGGATKAGVGVSIEEDRRTGRRYSVGGKGPEADMSTCCVDELNEMGMEPQTALNEMMEQGTYSPAKAGGKPYNARIAVLAAGNPPNGIYRRDKPLEWNLRKVNGSLLSRFDLIYLVPQHSRETVQRIGMHIRSRMNNSPLTKAEVLLGKTFLYIRKRRPAIDDEAWKKADEYTAKINELRGPVLGTARTLFGVLQFASGRANVLGHGKVTPEDVTHVGKIMLKAAEDAKPHDPAAAAEAVVPVDKDAALTAAVRQLSRDGRTPVSEEWIVESLKSWPEFDGADVAAMLREAANSYDSPITRTTAGTYRTDE